MQSSRSGRVTPMSLEALDTRVTALEERMEAFDFEQRQIKSELQSNTRLTEEVHGNTSDIVEFVADAKRFLKRSEKAGKWLTATCGGGAALVTLARVMGWW